MGHEGADDGPVHATHMFLITAARWTGPGCPRGARRARPAAARGPARPLRGGAGPGARADRGALLMRAAACAVPRLALVAPAAARRRRRRAARRRSHRDPGAAGRRGPSTCDPRGPRGTRGGAAPGRPARGRRGGAGGPRRAGSASGRARSSSRRAGGWRDVVWSRWERPRRRGRGRMVGLVCDPTCAQGTTITGAGDDRARRAGRMPGAGGSSIAAASRSASRDPDAQSTSWLAAPVLARSGSGGAAAGGAPAVAAQRAGRARDELAAPAARPRVERARRARPTSARTSSGWATASTSLAVPHHAGPPGVGSTRRTSRPPSAGLTAPGSTRRRSTRGASARRDGRAELRDRHAGIVGAQAIDGGLGPRRDAERAAGRQGCDVLAEARSRRGEAR